MKNKIKLFEPFIDSNEEKAITKIIRSKFWASGEGTGNVEKFESKFKKYVGSKECVAVNSGTAALHLALSLFDIKNREVILPSFSFVSTAHAITYNGGKPIFVDIDPQTLCINPSLIEKAITSKTKLILPVHFGGMPCNLNKINKIARKYNLDIIEDAAHAVGSTYNRKKIGNHNTAVCFSFHPVKNLAMPTGGLISINHKNHQKIRKLLSARRWCGITNRRDTDYDVHELGWNYYMNEFSAGIGLEQLKKLEKLNKIRKSIVMKYHKRINLETKMQYDKDCSYHLYWILVRNRKKFRQKLLEYGVETGTHYKPIHQMCMYKNSIHLPVTERIGKQIVTIPLHPNLKINQVERIIDLINRFG